MPGVASGQNRQHHGAQAPRTLWEEGPPFTHFAVESEP